MCSAAFPLPVYALFTAEAQTVEIRAGGSSAVNGLKICPKGSQKSALTPIQLKDKACQREANHIHPYWATCCCGKCQGFFSPSMTVSQRLPDGLLWQLSAGHQSGIHWILVWVGDRWTRSWAGYHSHWDYFIKTHTVFLHLNTVFLWQPLQIVIVLTFEHISHFPLPPTGSRHFLS